MNRPQIYMCPPKPEPSLFPAPHPILPVTKGLLPAESPEYHPVI